MQPLQFPNSRTQMAGFIHANCTFNWTPYICSCIKKSQISEKKMKACVWECLNLQSQDKTFPYFASSRPCLGCSSFFDALSNDLYFWIKINLSKEQFRIPLVVSILLESSSHICFNSLFFFHNDILISFLLTRCYLSIAFPVPCRDPVTGLKTRPSNDY